MSLTKEQIQAIHQEHLARGKTDAEALQGTRTDMHTLLLQAHPPAARAEQHTDEDAHHAAAHHGTDLWDEVDRLVHSAGLAPAPTPIAKDDRIIAPLAGHAHTRKGSQR